MCGICGVIGGQKCDTSQAVLQRMMGQMSHRGPDDAGMFLDHSVSLGMRRLSIIDLHGGHQPIFNEDGTVVVVFNGEIYNYQALRKTLQKLGHRFRTATDSEVIVHAYEEWGEDCVRHLEGMFAFALADALKSVPAGRPKVLLARDRLGIKPLYYALVEGSILFASEVRSLLASLEVKAQLSQSALHSYLLFGSVAEPMTMVEGVYSLPPGHRIIISAAGPHTEVRPEPYWEFAESANAPNEKKTTREDASAFVRLLIEKSVESHLLADVPVGVFLSGGIDSTALVAIAASKAASIRTVTAVFPQQEFSEAEIARRTARRYGTTHQELQLSGDDMLAHLDDAVGALDQPSMDGTNTYFVSWAAKQAGLKVVLSGLGGDELFGGYPSFHSSRRVQMLASFAARLPRCVRSMLAASTEGIAGGSERKDAYRKLAALWRDPSFLPHPYFYTRLLFTPSRASHLLVSDDPVVSAPWYLWLQQSAQVSSRLDEFTAISCLESRSYMLNVLLRDTDTMSMAHSLEARVPFLDHSIVEFVTGLPEGLKRPNGMPKSLLVEAMGDMLPAEVVSQRKRGFTLPWEYWLRGPLKKKMEDELHTLASPLQESLHAGAVEDVWKDFQNGRTNWPRVWSLFVLNRWTRKHLSKCDPENCAPYNQQRGASLAIPSVMPPSLANSTNVVEGRSAGR
jgi:asparagine synthase (glutamine-hydrolysing)